MYKIIIVDDEDEVREGIRQRIDWASCGFELIGDYSNGQDALYAMEWDAPNVVVTDINMPFMDGLELSEKIMESFYGTKIAIITGHDEFEYAKKAIKLEVKDYLLKPFNAKEFTDFLLSMRRELDEERQRHEDLTRLQIQLNWSFPLLKERFLENLVHTAMTDEYIASKFEFFQIQLKGPAYIALVVDRDLYDHHQSHHTFTESELLRFAVFNIFQEFFEKDLAGVVFQTREGKIGILYSGEESEIALKAQTLAKYARQSVEKYLKFTVTVGIGRISHKLGHLSKSFQEALSALDYRFLLGGNKIIAIDDLEVGTSMNYLQFNELEKKLYTAIRSGEDAKVKETIADWMGYVRHFSASVERSYNYIYKLIAELMNQLAEMGYDEREVFDPNIFSHIQTMKTLDEVQHWLEMQCQRMLDYLKNKRTDAALSQIQLAESYIRDQYSDPELSLKAVCQYVFMSISYFSALFKQHTGETFVEYLTRIRMEKAKELLIMSDLKIYEIAIRVGYVDSQYFSVIFKRYTNMTPKEFRTKNERMISQ